MSQLKIKDGNSWINIPAGGIGVPSGGNQGDALVKSSATDYATEWALPLSIKLLWTNPSPTSDFAAQTVSLDLSNYSFVLIYFKWAKNDASYSPILAKVGLKFTYSNIFNARIVREGTVSTTGIAFTVGYQASRTADTSTSNGYAVPYQIYGIKGIQ